ncbi:MAG: hypothetical protein OQL19_09595 [Gammaproteobacteria bacterium]|nr:hypothetical protein [Gammaproteobacteria bacterium]
MRIILNLIYFIIFIALAFIAMFLGGVSGVAGTFYLMVEPGDIEANMTKLISFLIVFWLLLMVLRHQNKKVIKRRKREQIEQEAE